MQFVSSKRHNENDWAKKRKCEVEMKVKEEENR
jgi:hypothetical protein